MKKIPLSKNKFALVDDEDFGFLSQWKWCVDARDYAVRSEKRSETGEHFRKVIRMQRQILNAPRNKLVDHINGDTLDNRKINLRLASKSENMRNRKISYRTKSGFKGVWFDPKRNKYVAYIKYGGRSWSLGRRDTAKEAAEVYNLKAKEIFGEFARLNLL